MLQRFATFAKLPALSRVRLPCRGQGLPRTGRSDAVRRAARWTRELCPCTNRENGVQPRRYRLRRNSVRVGKIGGNAEHTPDRLDLLLENTERHLVAFLSVAS